MNELMLLILNHHLKVNIEKDPLYPEDEIIKVDIRTTTGNLYGYCKLIPKYDLVVSKLDASVMLLDAVKEFINLVDSSNKLINNPEEEKYE